MRICALCIMAVVCLLCDPSCLAAGEGKLLLEQAFDSMLVSFYETADTTTFGAFEAFLDTLPAQQQYNAFHHVFHYLLYGDSGLDSGNYAVVESVAIEFLMPLYIRFWADLLTYDSLVMDAAVRHLPAGRAEFSPYLLEHFSPQSFTLSNLVLQRDFVRDGGSDSGLTLVRCAAVIDSMATFVVADTACSDAYRRSSQWLARLADSERLSSPVITVTVDSTILPAYGEGCIVSASEAFMVGREPHALYYTHNGGMSWGRRTCPYPEPRGLLRYAPKLRLIDCSSGFIIGPEGTTYVTTDSGRSWEQDRRFFISRHDMVWVMGSDSGRYAHAARVENLQTLSDGSLLAFACDDYLCSGPRRWEPNSHEWSSPLADFRLHTLGDLSVGVDGRILAHAGREGLWRSSDFGKSWIRIAGDVPFVTQVGLAEADITVGAGPYGWLAASADGGATWARRFVPYAGDFGELALNDSGLALAVGDYYGLYLSTDNGASWQDAGVYMEDDLRWAAFFTPRTGLLVGSRHLYRFQIHGRIAAQSRGVKRTTDGGKQISIHHQGSVLFTHNVPVTTSSVEVYDLTGRLVSTLVGGGVASIGPRATWPLPPLARGPYLVVVRTSGREHIERMVPR